jgi:ribonucrease Y
MEILYPIIGSIFGASVASVFFFVWENRKFLAKKQKWDDIIQKAYSDAKEIVSDSKNESRKLLSEAKNESYKLINDAKRDSNTLMQKNEKIEEKLLDREDRLEKKIEEIEKKKEEIKALEEGLTLEKDELKSKQEELDGKIWEIAKLSEEDAKKIFIGEIKKRYEKDGVTAIERYKKELEKNKKEEAREIILRSIQQYAWDVTNEVTNTMIELPWDEIKGKLIGKEWRNITAFERATWVALIIDDTPGSVFISAFDLFRRYVAKKSLEKLIEDGRIQPARIEEVVESTTQEADVLLRELWEKALTDLWISGKVPEEIVPIIGKLRFRTSYGQNMLRHSIEVAIIAENLAKELWVKDTESIRIWGLLHDIWKALDQDFEWGHPEIGGNLWRKYKLSDTVIDMIENHHWEPFSISLQASIIQVADAISSVRPWARRENIELYIKRIQEMEALVQSFSGVSKAFAISAWREIRVYVDAATTSDVEAEEMASKIAWEIEANLQYPWEVKVNLIREMRVIQYAR